MEKKKRSAKKKLEELKPEKMDHQDPSPYTQCYSFVKMNQPETAKNIRVYLNGDNYFAGRKIVVNRRYVPDFTGFLNEVTMGIRAPFGAVRNIYTPNSGRKISNLDQLQTGMNVVAAGMEKFRKLEYAEIGLRRRNQHKKRNYLDIRLHNKMNVSARWRKYVRDPCLIYVYGNGDMNTPAVRLLLIPRTLKTWDTVMEEITEKMSLRTGKAVRKLYDMDYRLLNNPTQLENGQYYVAVGTERLKKYPYGDIPKVQSSRKVFHHLPPIKTTSKLQKQTHEGGDKTYTKMYAQKKAKQSEFTILPATAATNYQPLKIKTREDPRAPPPTRPDKKEAESVILAKPVKVKRSHQSAKPTEPVYPVSSANEIDGVFRSSFHEIKAEQVGDSDDVKVDLPIDQVPADIVEEEFRSENVSPLERSSTKRSKSKSADSRKSATEQDRKSRSKSGSKLRSARNGSTRDDVSGSLASDDESRKSRFPSIVQDQPKSTSKSPSLPELMKTSGLNSFAENTSEKSAHSQHSKLEPISRKSADPQHPDFEANLVAPEYPEFPAEDSVEMGAGLLELSNPLGIPAHHDPSKPFVFNDAQNDDLAKASPLGTDPEHAQLEEIQPEQDYPEQDYPEQDYPENDHPEQVDSKQDHPDPHSPEQSLGDETRQAVHETSSDNFFDDPVKSAPSQTLNAEKSESRLSLDEKENHNDVIDKKDDAESEKASEPHQELDDYSSTAREIMINQELDEKSKNQELDDYSSTTRESSESQKKVDDQTENATKTSETDEQVGEYSEVVEETTDAHRESSDHSEIEGTVEGSLEDERLSSKAEDVETEKHKTEDGEVSAPHSLSKPSTNASEHNEIIDGEVSAPHSLSKPSTNASEHNEIIDGEVSAPHSLSKPSTNASEHNEIIDEPDNSQDSKPHSGNIDKKTADENVRNIFDEEETNEVMETGEINSVKHDNDFDEFFGDDLDPEQKKRGSSNSDDLQAPNPSGWINQKNFGLENTVENEGNDLNANSARITPNDDSELVLEDHRGKEILNENKEKEKQDSSPYMSPQNPDQNSQEEELDHLDANNLISRRAPQTQSGNIAQGETPTTTN